MKKRVLNVLLSVVVATSMMFTLTACGKKSLDSWVNSKAATTTVDYMNENLDGMTVAFEADGDVFSMVFTLDETIEVAEGAEEAMAQVFDTQKAQFESIRDELIKETGNSNVSVRVVYINGDGSEIFSTEF